MKIELQIEGKPSKDTAFFNVSINGKEGIGRTRLTWDDCGDLIARFEHLMRDRHVSTRACAAVFADLAPHAQREQEVDRLDKRFRSLAGKASPLKDRGGLLLSGHGLPGVCLHIYYWIVLRDPQPGLGSIVPGENLIVSIPKPGS